MVEFRGDGSIRVDRDLSLLDELARDISRILSEQNIGHVLVSGYIAVLFGRSRATEDIDTLVATEELSKESAGRLGSELQERGYWGPAMPLSDIATMFEHNEPIRVAREGERIPSVELQPTESHHPSFQNQRTAIVGPDDNTVTLPIVALEIQIAYKLRMQADRDFEDAYFLLQTYYDELDTNLLEASVSNYEVEAEYDELKAQAEME